MAIIEQYRNDEPKHDLVFPDLKKLPNLADNLKLQEYIKVRIKANNKQFQKVLKEDSVKIDKKVTMYISMHTNGNISGDKIPVQMLQKLYRHSSITTTIGYQANFIHKDADSALDLVIDF